MAAGCLQTVSSGLLQLGTRGCAATGACQQSSRLMQTSKQHRHRRQLFTSGARPQTEKINSSTESPVGQVAKAVTKGHFGTCTCSGVSACGLKARTMWRPPCCCPAAGALFPARRPAGPAGSPPAAQCPRALRCPNAGLQSLKSRCNPRAPLVTECRNSSCPACRGVAP